MLAGTFRRVVAVGLAAGVLSALPGTALATTGSGVSGTVLRQWTAHGTDYVVREITIQPGGSTGWHFHDGVLYAYVKQGTLTRTMSDCTTSYTSRPRDVVVEEPGSTHVHLGRNLGSDAVVLDVLYVLPHGSPLSEDAANPGCSFQ